MEPSSSVLVSYGCYPFSFLQKLTKTGKPNNNAEPANDFKATAVLPYVKGLPQQLRRCLQQQDVRAVFKSETTLRSQLVRPKDTVDLAKQDGVVYRIPCEYGEVYIGQTGRPLQDRIKEHDRDIRLARTETSAEEEVMIKIRSPNLNICGKRYQVTINTVNYYLAPFID